MSIRNQEIYKERVVEKRTLQAIANKHDISRERVRQIVRKINEDAELKKSFPENPVLICDIQWTRRTYNCLYNENLNPMPLRDFIKYAETNDLFRIPNLGKISLGEIKTKLANHGYTLPDLKKEKKITLKQIREEKRKSRKQRDDLIVEHYLDFRKLDWISEKVGLSKQAISIILRRRLGDYHRRDPSDGN
jgi:hypothetical protein